MKFDFDTPPDRRTSDSRKWRKYAGTDVIPLWIADMDFRSAPAILEALHQRIDQGNFGYGMAVESVTESLVEYCARRYHWSIQPEWIVWIPGLVTGLNIAAAAYGSAGDGVLTFTPVYPPFLGAPRNQARETVGVPLARRPDGRHEIDFDALARAAHPRCTQLSLCSPHNPVGRVFSRAELARLAEFCAERRLVVTADEVHCDLILDDLAHVPFASLSPDASDRTVTLMSPSKAYNVAGLACAFAIIANPGLRTSFRRAISGMVPETNVLGFTACEAAYRHGEPWLRALNDYLRGNRDLIAAFVARELPGVVMTPCEATYLAWLDVACLGQQNPGAYLEKFGLGVADGAQYGAEPGRYIRLNFGCSRALLTEALHRLRRAVSGR